MHPTRVTSLDVICGDLKSWNSSNSCTSSDEDIGLIDTSRHLAIWRCDSRHSLHRDTSIISGKSEEIECRPSIVSYDLSDDLYIYLIHHHTSTCECRICSDGDMAIVFFVIFDSGYGNLDCFILRNDGNLRNLDCFVPRNDGNCRSHETILHLESFANDDSGTFDKPSVDDMTVFIDANIRTCDLDSLHRCTIGKIYKNAIGFFRGFL